MARVSLKYAAIAFVLAPLAMDCALAQAPAGGPSRPVAAPSERPQPGAGRADQRPPAVSPAPLPAESVTQHTLTLSDRTLSFTAAAGSLQLIDPESGAPRADIAYIAYRKAGTDARTRPVAFVFNGGPGYASAWLDLGALGPWRLPMSGDADRPSATAAVIDNVDTWLDFTDLVFLDPPGTGYSRVLGGDESRKALWSVDGDANALAVAIRRWSEANNRMLSPKFIVGESYGGFRTPKIAHLLQTDQGVGVDGMIMISPVLDFSRWQNGDSVLGLAARLPGMAATWRERQMAKASPPRSLTRADMTDVEDYASGAFIADLLKGPDDAAAVERLSVKVAELTGLDPAFTRRLGGRVSNELFAREIDRADKSVSSLYDGNTTALDPAPFAPRNFADDALLRGLHAPMVQAMVDVYHNRLNWIVENGRYQFANDQAARQWDYGRRPPSVIGDLAEAMALDPTMRALVAHGFTDLVTPYYETKLELDQIPHTGAPGRLRLRVYPGGHMMYARDASRQALREDARALIEGR